jgi:hypothetical protein
VGHPRLILNERGFLLSVTQHDLQNPEAIVVLSPHMAFEHFESRALLLDLHSQTLTELDKYQAWMIEQLDGRRSLADIVNALGATFDINDDAAIDMANALYIDMLQKGYLYLKHILWQGEIKMAHYVQNPDVNIREEDTDGALLFNPDTNQVQVLNRSGMYIWKMCEKGCTIPEIVEAIKADFDDVPDEEVEGDVEEFIQAMTNTGFLGMTNGS